MSVKYLFAYKQGVYLFATRKKYFLNNPADITKAVQKLLGFCQQKQTLMAF